MSTSRTASKSMLAAASLDGSLEVALNNRGKNASASDVKEVFKKCDKNGVGLINRDVLANVLLEVLPGFTMEMVQSLLDAAYCGEEGTVPYKTFLDHLFGFPGLPSVSHEDLGYIFSYIDAKGTGYLEKEEVLAVARSQDKDLVEFCQQFPDLRPFFDIEKWEETFIKMDTSQNKMISWFEFVRFFSARGEPETAPVLTRTLSGRAATQVAEEDLLAVFAGIDTKRNGVLEKSEVLAAVHGEENSALRDFVAQIPALQPLLCPERWEAAFTAADTAGDGVVSWSEFCRFFKRRQ